MLLLLMRGVLCQLLHLNTVLISEERQHTLQIGVSIGVHGRRVTGPIVSLSVLYGIILMAVRQQSVEFPDTCCDTITISMSRQQMQQNMGSTMVVALCLPKANFGHKYLMFYLLLLPLKEEVHMEGEMRRCTIVSV
jgi:ABC-type sulfate transport system permease subunit